MYEVEPQGGKYITWILLLFGVLGSIYLINCWLDGGCQFCSWLHAYFAS